MLARAGHTPHPRLAVTSSAGFSWWRRQPASPDATTVSFLRSDLPSLQNALVRRWAFRGDAMWRWRRALLAVPG